jgi:hypothetical protein
MKGGCHKGTECRFSHNVRTLVENEVCKFFLSGLCAKGEACPFSHNLKLLPCRYFHTIGCTLASCRFAHSALTDETRARLNKDLEQYEARINHELGIAEPESGAPDTESDPRAQELREHLLAKASASSIFASELPPPLPQNEGDHDGPGRPARRKLQPAKTHRFLVPAEPPQQEEAGEGADNVLLLPPQEPERKEAEDDKEETEQQAARVLYDPDYVARAAPAWEPPSYLTAEANTEDASPAASGPGPDASKDGEAASGDSVPAPAQSEQLHPMKALLAARAMHRMQQKAALQQQKQQQHEQRAQEIDFDLPHGAPPRKARNESLETQFLQRDPTASPFF